MRNARLVFTLAFLTACGSPNAAEPASTAAEPTSGAEALEEGLYRIQLSRSARVDERYRVHTVHSRGMTRAITAPGRSPERSEETSEVELFAQVHVREVNAQGKATELDYAIERCVVRDAAGEREVVPPGASIHVTRVPHEEGHGRIELLGGSLTDGQRESLELVMSTTYSPISEDAVFGSESPRRVGESWPIDAELAAHHLSKMPSLELGSDQVSGQTTLVAAEDIAGVPCLRFRAEMRAQGFAMPEMPEGSTTDRAEMTATMIGLLPTDARIDALAEEEEMTMSVRVRVPAGPDGDAQLAIDMIEREITEYQR